MQYWSLWNYWLSFSGGNPNYFLDHPFLQQTIQSTFFLFIPFVRPNQSDFFSLYLKRNRIAFWFLLLLLASGGNASKLGNFENTQTRPSESLPKTGNSERETEKKVLTAPFILKIKIYVNYNYF